MVEPRVTRKWISKVKKPSSYRCTGKLLVKLLFDFTWETDSGPLWGWQRSTWIEKQKLIMYVDYYWLHSARCYKRNVSSETN